MANDLNLVVKLKDEASKGFQQLEKTVQKFGKANQTQAQIIQRHMKEASKSYKNAEKDIAKMTKEMEKSKNVQKGWTTSIIKGGLALAGLQIGLMQVGRFLSASVQETLEYRNALNATTSSIRAFGLAEENLLPAVQELTQDGLLTQADAYRALSQLLAGGLNIEEATELTQKYKDVAAFGRDTTLSFADAVKNNAEAFLTEMSVLGNRAGLQENFNQLIQLGADEMGKSVSALTANERAQAKRIGTLIVAQRAEGNAAKMADTFQGSLIRQQTTLKDVQRMVGDALAPALKQATTAFNQASSSGKALGAVLKVLGTILVGVVGAVRILATSFTQMARTAKAAIRDIQSSLKNGKLAFTEFSKVSAQNILEMGEVVEDVGDSVMEIWNGVGDEIGRVTRANRDWMDENAKSAKKMAEDIAKEMQRFNESIRKMNMQFNESMKDLIVAHKDRVKSLEKDLVQEKERFDEAMKDKKRRFDDAMKDLEKRHGDKTKKVIAQLEKEKLRTKEEISEIAEEYDLLLDDIRKNGDNRLLSLKAQLDKEKARQSTANKERIKILNRMIKEEKIAIADSIKKHEELKKDEIDDELAERDERLSEIQSGLDEENNSFEEAVREREDLYQEETDKLASENIKRRLIIQVELDIEKEIQKKHAEEFAKFKDAVAQDDISRLKTKHAQSRSEEERAHQQRLKDIRRREGESRTVSSGGGVGSTSVSIPKFESQAAKTSFRAPQPGEAGFIGPLQAPSQPSFIDKAKDTVSNFFKGISFSASRFFGNLPGFAEGGDFTVGGKSGRDQNVVAFRASRGERVSIQTPQQQSAQGNTVINAPITVVDSEVDVDQLLERLSWSLNKSGIVGIR